MARQISRYHVDLCNPAKGLVNNSAPVEKVICFLIDDDGDDREIFEIALEEAGNVCECVTAHNGIDALQKLNADENEDILYCTAVGDHERMYPDRRPRTNSKTNRHQCQSYKDCARLVL